MVEKLVVVIVLYNPQKEHIEGILSADLSCELILVDNTPEFNLNISKEGIYYIPLMKNMGIAAAQNIGINKAFDMGASYIVFFDQDSKIEMDFIYSIYQEYVKLEVASDNIPILGPIILNRKLDKPYKMEKGQLNNGFTKVKTLICSGSIMRIDIFKEIGFMNSSFFIDYVDFDLCWRAASKGHYSYITNKVQLLHTVGQSTNTFLGIPIIGSVPIRYYYQYRNFIWLCRESYVPLIWKIKVMIRKSFELIYMPIISAHGLQILRNMILGIKDGIFK